MNPDLSRPRDVALFSRWSIVIERRYERGDVVAFRCGFFHSHTGAAVFEHPTHLDALTLDELTGRRKSAANCWSRDWSLSREIRYVDLLFLLSKLSS
jgi:hypothetical protein